jgi:hypothetical protein
VVTIRCFTKDPTSQKNLEAVLFVRVNDGRNITLTAEVGWCRRVDGNIEMDQPPLWREIHDLEDSEPVPESIATDESD